MPVVQSVAIRVTMIYGTRLPTKFYSEHSVRYCKNNFNNIIEHAAINESSQHCNSFVCRGYISRSYMGKSKNINRLKSQTVCSCGEHSTGNISRAWGNTRISISQLKTH
jgi:hypothetical protein